MNRREAVRRIALLMGGAMVGSEVILSGQAIPDKQPAAGFTDADKALLDEIGETIIPATDIPGAKAAKIGAFMTMMVTDCYNDKQHAAFLRGPRPRSTTPAGRSTGPRSWTARPPSAPSSRTRSMPSRGPVQPDEDQGRARPLFPDDEGADDPGLFLVRDRLHPGGEVHRGARRLPRRRPYKKGDSAWY
jgi:hypothetical protein